MEIAFRPRSARLLQRSAFLRRQFEPGAERVGVRSVLEAVPDERRAVGDGAEQIERADPAFEEVHDALLLPPAVSIRRRHDIDMMRKLRADLLTPLLAVKPAHGFLLSM